MKFSVLLVAAATAAARFPLPMAHIRHVDSVWVDEGRAADDHPMGLVIALKLRNTEALAAIVDDRADPDSPRYAQWLTREQVRDVIQPSADAVEAVVRFCSGPLAGTAEVNFMRDFVTCVAPAVNVSRTFGADIRRFSHRHSKRALVRAHPRSPITIPAEHHEAAAAVAVIEGLADFFTYPSDHKATRAAKEAAYMADSAKQGPMIKVSTPRGSETRPTIVAESNVPGCSDWTLSANGLVTMNPTVLSDTAVVFTPDYKDWVRLWNISVTATCGGSSVTGAYPAPFYTPSPWGTPQLVAAQYKMQLQRLPFDPRASQSVASFEQQYYSPSDLLKFTYLHGLPPQRVNLVGPNEGSNPGGEATLDIQWVSAMAPGSNTTFWSVGGPGPAHGSAYVLTWAQQVLNDANPPLVTSISYGDTEMGYLGKFGDYSYIYRMEQALMQMASMGHTVIAGSGDAGATNVGEMGNDISDPDPDCSIMRPFYPSNSHYVVGVSATFLNRYATPACSALSSENGVEVGPCGPVGESPTSIKQGTFWTTGGGFSGILPRPAWQEEQVHDYLAATFTNRIFPNARQFNSSGRGYPDVSTIGYNLECVQSGGVVPIGGTSASGPVLAGIFTQLNNMRIAFGGTPVGPPHKVLYKKNPKADNMFNDIVIGDNADGDVQYPGSMYPAMCPNGFPASSGWDAVSGLGTPIFPQWESRFVDFLRARKA